MMTVEECAISVLDTVRDRIARGEWVKGIWYARNINGNTCRCLHGHLDVEVRALGPQRPIKVESVVFHAVWDALPDWAGTSIPTFNDAWTTTREDVLAVVTKARRAIERERAVGRGEGRS